MKKTKLITIALVLLLCACIFAACSSKEEPAASNYDLGYEAGYELGYVEGENSAYSQGYYDGYDVGYNDRVLEEEANEAAGDEDAVEP